MSLNWKEIELILQELPLKGSRIQEIRQPDFKSLVLELYHPSRPWKLYVNLSANHSRIHLLTKKPPAARSPQRFVELLRSRIRGGKIVETSQPGGNRIVRMDIVRGGEPSILWIRLWGPSSNILLTDAAGTILDAFYRRPKQGEVSGGHYLPPIQDEPSSSRSYEVRPYPSEQSFNQFIEEYYRGLEEEEQRKKLTTLLERQLDALESRLHARLKSLQKRKEEYGNYLQFKKQGDLILSHLHEIKKGDSLLSVQDPDSGSLVAIPLSPTLAPVENAEAYFKRYKKAKVGLELLEEDLREIQRQLEQVQHQRSLLRSNPELSTLNSLSQSFQGKKGEKQGTPTPGLTFQSNGFTILVGRTAQENDELLRRYVRGNDFWLHTRDYPGAYVFIKGKPGKSIPLDTLLDAAHLAIFFSKAREAGIADLYYTQVKYLRRAKGAKLGTVLPTQEKNLTVKVEEHRLRRLLEP
ncbi:MAG: NFACT family protein [Spirochaetales bacterium]